MSKEAASVPSRLYSSVVAVRVGGRHDGPHVLPRGRVLRHAAGFRGVGEHRRAVGRAGRARPVGRPVAGRLPVEGPHLHLVFAGRIQRRDRRGRAGAAVRPGAPAPAALAVLHLVAGQRRAPVQPRRRPADVQAVGRVLRRRHGRRRRRRRLLGHVGDRDRHRDRVAAAVAVVGLDGDRVAVLGLVVVGHSRLGLDLPGG